MYIRLYYLSLICISRLTFLQAEFSYTDRLIDLVTNYVKFPGANPIQEIIEEAKLEATELIKFYGYPVENQTIKTSDNYFLISQRILNGKFNNASLNQSRIPVVLLHSLSCESPQFFDSGESSLAFYLADEGYDVWTANFRGTSYSYHSNYTYGSKAFWNFSIDDYVFKDVPAIIDHVLEVTGYSKLLLIGHSLGASVPILTLAAKPEYNTKVAGFVAMAPVIVPKYGTGLLSPLLGTGLLEFIRYAINKFEINSWGTLNEWVQKINYHICPSSVLPLCELPIYIAFGYNPYLRNRTRMVIFGNHCSSGLSGKETRQMIDAIMSSKLKRFDYGPEENRKLYGRRTPPGYDLSKVTTPIAIIYAPNDCVSTPLNTAILARKLPNLIGIEAYPDPRASHSDFIWAVSAKELIYTKVIKYLKLMWK